MLTRKLLEKHLGLIKTDEGEKIIRTGEVSVRGLYGYV